MIDHLLSIRVAAFSLIGYCLSVAGPVYLDPKLTTHVIHRARTHSHCWVWWAFAPVAFLLPYIGLNFVSSKPSILAMSIAPLVVSAAILSVCFPPERPHSAVVFPALAFTVVIVVTIAFRLMVSDFSFVADITIPFESRLERVKAVVTYWQMISVYGAAGYLAFVVTWVYAMWFTTDKRVSSPEDRYTLGQAQVTFALVLSMSVLVGPLAEAFSNSHTAMEELSRVLK
jgi:hypothetical protein